MVRVYERRLGCEVDRRVVTANDAEKLIESEAGVFTGGVYEYTRETYEDDRALTVTGTRSPDQTWVEALDDYDNGTLTASYVETGAADGSVHRDFEEYWSGSDSSVIGSWDQAPDGARQWSYTLQHATDLVFDYEHDFFGDGEGTVLIGGETECAVTIKDFECTYRCGDDPKEAC